MSDTNTTMDWCPLWSRWVSRNSGNVIVNAGRILDIPNDEIGVIKILDLNSEVVTEVSWKDWKSWYESGKIYRMRGSFTVK